jgi:hypothetical protein
MKLQKFTALMLLLLPTLVCPFKGQAAEGTGQTNRVKALSLPNTHFINAQFDEPSSERE